MPDKAFSRFACLVVMLIAPDGDVRPLSVPAGPFSTSIWSMLKMSCDTEPRSRIPSTKMLLDASKPRSEEHTSELQSLMRISYAVFCLKKKKNQTKHKKDRQHTL